MLALSIAGFALGTSLFPPHDEDAVLPQWLRVEVPALINDGRGSWPFQGLSWYEIHDNPHHFQPELPPHTVRAEITVVFDKKLDENPGATNSIDSPLKIKVGLPDQAEVIRCASNTTIHPSSKFDCSMQDTRTNGTDSPILTKRYLQVDGAVNRDLNTMSFTIDVKGVDGLAYVTNRTRASISIPSAFPRPIFWPLPKFGESVVATIPDTGKFTWSMRPNDEMYGYYAAWAQSSDNASYVPITGVREDLLRQDRTREFWAGIVLGLAGAGVIGFCQSLFSAGRQRRRRRTASSGFGGLGEPLRSAHPSPVAAPEER